MTRTKQQSGPQIHISVHIFEIHGSNYTTVFQEAIKVVFTFRASLHEKNSIRRKFWIDFSLSLNYISETWHSTLMFCKLWKSFHLLLHEASMCSSVSTLYFICMPCIQSSFCIPWTFNMHVSALKIILTSAVLFSNERQDWCSQWLMLVQNRMTDSAYADGLIGVTTKNRWMCSPRNRSDTGDTCLLEVVIHYKVVKKLLWQPAFPAYQELKKEKFCL